MIWRADAGATGATGGAGADRGAGAVATGFGTAAALALATAAAAAAARVADRGFGVLAFAPPVFPDWNRACCSLRSFSAACPAEWVPAPVGAGAGDEATGADSARVGGAAVAAATAAVAAVAADAPGGCCCCCVFALEAFDPRFGDDCEAVFDFEPLDRFFVAGPSEDDLPTPALVAFRFFPSPALGLAAEVLVVETAAAVLLVGTAVVDVGLAVLEAPVMTSGEFTVGELVDDGKRVVKSLNDVDGRNAPRPSSIVGGDSSMSAPGWFASVKSALRVLLWSVDGSSVGMSVVRAIIQKQRGEREGR